MSISELNNNSVFRGIGKSAKEKDRGRVKGGEERGGYQMGWKRGDYMQEEGVSGLIYISVPVKNDRIRGRVVLVATRPVL